MGKKVEYKQNLKGIGDSSADVDVVDVKIPLGYKRIIQNLSLEDESNDFTEVRIGYDRDGTLHWWIEEETLLEADLYWMDNAKVLEAGDILTIRFVGTTDNDVLAVYVDGYTEKMQT